MLGRNAFAISIFLLAFTLVLSPIKTGTVKLTATTTSNQQNCFAPPDNFDFQSATDSELEYYGLPHRPVAASSSLELLTWEDVVSHAKHRVCSPTDGPPNVFHTPNKNNSSTTSSSWGGIVRNQESDGISGARGFFTMNCLGSGQTGGYESTYWVGIGGYYTNTLFQAGYDPRYAEFWVQWWVRNQIIMSKAMFQIPCGDLGYVTVWDNYSWSGCSSGLYAFAMDYTTGMYADTTNSGQYPGLCGGAYDSQTAEWIVERSSCNSDASQLYHFGSIGTVNWTSSAYWNNSYSQKAIDQDSNYYSVTAIRSDSAPLMTPSNLHSDGYNTDAFQDSRSGNYDSDSVCTG